MHGGHSTRGEIAVSYLEKTVCSEWVGVIRLSPGRPIAYDDVLAGATSPTEGSPVHDFEGNTCRNYDEHARVGPPRGRGALFSLRYDGWTAAALSSPNRPRSGQPSKPCTQIATEPISYSATADELPGHLSGARPIIRCQAHQGNTAQALVVPPYKDHAVTKVLSTL